MRPANRLVLAADVDGTLAFSGSPPGPAVAATLTELVYQRPDVRLVLATSRPPHAVHALVGPLAKDVDLLCCNGALRVSRDGTTTRTTLPAALLHRLLAALQAGRAEFCLDYGDHFVASSATAMPWMGRRHRRLLRVGEHSQLSGVVKLAVAGSARWLPRLTRLTRLAGRHVEIYHHHTTYDFDITPAGVTKGAALAALLADAGATPPMVIAFGNDTNDRDLITRADAAVVVGDLLPDLAADHIRRVRATDAAVAAALTEELDRAARYLGDDLKVIAEADIAGMTK